MPGSVQNASPVAVLPWSLSVAFVRSQEYPVLENEYRNGESQRSVEATNSRKAWRRHLRLALSQLAVLLSFYMEHHGPLIPFYFYDPYETSPKFSYDATGQSLAGRYTVRFGGVWVHSIGLGRADVTIELVEVA